jgi:hypothetical protein
LYRFQACHASQAISAEAEDGYSYGASYDYGYSSSVSEPKKVTVR